jgi:hypothetical protein
MATENTENQGFGDFGIKDTMEMGLGNAQLLADLYAPETSTTEPTEITPIVKEAVSDAPPADPEKVPLKGKDISPPKDGEEPSTKTNIINNFLGDHEEEQTVEDDDVTSTIVEDTQTTTQETQFSALSRDLFKLGVFTSEEDEEEQPINTPEEFLDRFHNEKRKGAIDMVNNFISQFGEDYQQAFDAIFVKGVDPRDYFQAYNTAVNFAEMDMTIESNQEMVMRRSLADQGFEPDDIDTEIERLKSYGDLEAVSVRNHKVLIKKETVRMQEMEQKAQHELAQRQAVKNQFVTNVQSVIQEKLKTKEFDGIPLNPKLATELQDFLLVDKYKTSSGETLTDFDKMILDLKRPENHAQKVKIALLLKVLEKDPTLTTIQRAGVTKKTDQLFSEVARQVTKGKETTSNNTTNKPNSWFV